MDPTEFARMECWKERLEKERSCAEEAGKYRGPPSYVLNVANLAASGGLEKVQHSHSRLEIIADKIQKRTPQDLAAAPAAGDAGGTAFELSAMRHAQKVPAKKWDLPQTRAQELGWFISQPVRADALRARRLAKRYDPMLTASAGPSGGLVLTASSSAPCLSASQPGGPRLSPLMPDCGPAPEMSVLNTPQWRKPRGQCAITKYADIYVKQMRCSPFNQSLAGR